MSGVHPWSSDKEIAAHMRNERVSLIQHAKVIEALGDLQDAIREHRNQTERDFSADITTADERLWKALG